MQILLVVSSPASAQYSMKKIVTSQSSNHIELYFSLNEDERMNRFHKKNYVIGRITFLILIVIKFCFGIHLFIMVCSTILLYSVLFYLILQRTFVEKEIKRIF